MWTRRILGCRVARILRRSRGPSTAVCCRHRELKIVSGSLPTRFFLFFLCVYQYQGCTSGFRFRLSSRVPDFDSNFTGKLFLFNLCHSASGSLTILRNREKKRKKTRSAIVENQDARRMAESRQRRVFENRYETHAKACKRNSCPTVP